MSRFFENIFQKYNITCEAPQKRKKYPKTGKLPSSKGTNENQKKNVPYKNYCLHTGTPHEEPAQDNQDKQFHTNKNNLSLPSSLHLNETNKAAEDLKIQCNKNDNKMWQLMKSTRLSLMQYKSLDERITKLKKNINSNKTNEAHLSRTLSSSPLTYERIKVSRENIKWDEFQEGDTNEELNKSSTCHQTTISKNQSELNSSHFLNSSTTEEDTPGNFSLNRHYQQMTNTSILRKSNSFNIKKKKQQTKRSRFKPLDITITQKSKSILNTSTIGNQKSKSITTSNNLHSNIPSHDLSFSSSSSSSEENESFRPFISSSPKPSQIIDTPTTSSQKSTDQPTELDLLLELIEHDDKQRAPKTKRTSQVIPSPKKACLKGGYEELFIRALDRVKISGRYLKHDKKFGLKNGVPLKVVKLETSYNVNIATVECMEYKNVFCIVIAPEMMAQINSGTIIEAFFDDTSIPYKLQTKEGSLDLFLEPYKLLVG